MLWNKESEAKDALYVDIFPQKEIFNIMFPPIIAGSKHLPPAKNNKLSSKKLKEGEKLFARKKWTDAMEKYNESLCYAVRKSRNIGLAYANRSACFIKTKKYNECLIDIELAKKASQAPDNLMTTLEQRESECLKLIEDDARTPDDFGLKLNFETDDKFPCMANILKIERDVKGVYSVIAKEDVGVGEVVVIDQSYRSYLYMRYGLKCNICLKGNTNLFPCDECSNAMFCSEDCQAHHNYECGLVASNESQENGLLMRNIRSILSAIELFSNIDELMNFVEEVINSDPNEIPDSFSDEKSKLCAFLKLPFGAMAQEESFWFTAFNINKLLLGIPDIAAQFKSPKNHRFLMHFVGHNLLITDYRYMRAVPVDIYTQLSIMMRFFQHSCAPNVLIGDRDGKNLYITIRPIEKGEQLKVSYFEFLKDPKADRNDALRTIRNIICKCARCEGVIPTRSQRNQIHHDPDFQFILSNFPKLNQTDDAAVQEMIKRCIAFASKYRKVPWYEEIGDIVNIFTQLLCIRSIGLTISM